MFVTLATVYCAGRYNMEYKGVGPVIVDLVAWITIGYIAHLALA